MIGVQVLWVWAERYEGFVCVGMLSFDADGNERFEYDASYLEDGLLPPIYPILPLQSGRFTPQQTRAAFASLGPEGAVGHNIRVSLRAGRDAVTPVLARLNHETIGALTFSSDGNEPCFEEMPAKPFDASRLEAFARNPERIALDAMLDSRLSLNGAVSKIGVTKQGDSFFLPQGLIPSTHILKAGSQTFPHQMLNEALCMRCAMECGFDDAPQTDLIVIDGYEPILVTKRFDRTNVPDRPQGLPRTMRLHQADFCQTLGISTDALKYTPSDDLVEGYTTSVAQAVTRESSERYGDRSYLFSVLTFDYLMGNCDNHLKNISLTWTRDWSSKSVSPIYDITCTSIYEELSREMGMGIGRHRTIEQVEPADFHLMARQLGVGWQQMREDIGQMAESIQPALMNSAHKLESEGVAGAVKLAEELAEDCQPRIDVVRKAAFA